MKTYQPVVTPAKQLVYRKKDGPQPRSLRPLTPETLSDFIAIERPHSAIDNAYARCVATLDPIHKTFPEHIYQIAVRIDTDGNEHFIRFKRTQQILQNYNGTPYLRQITPGTQAQAARAVAEYKKILEGLAAGYSAEAGKQFSRADQDIQEVRAIMDRFRREAERLGRQGIGVPFWPETE